MTTSAPNCDQPCADEDGQINIKVPQRNSHGFVTEWCIDEDADSGEALDLRGRRAACDATVDRAMSVIALPDALVLRNGGEGSSPAVLAMEPCDSDSDEQAPRRGPRRSSRQPHDVADGPQRGLMSDPDAVESAEMTG